MARAVTLGCAATGFPLTTRSSTTSAWRRSVPPNKGFPLQGILRDVDGNRPIENPVEVGCYPSGARPAAAAAGMSPGRVHVVVSRTYLGFREPILSSAGVPVGVAP